MKMKLLKNQSRGDIQFHNGEGGYAKVTVIHPGEKPSEIVSYPEIGLGDYPVKIEDRENTWWEYSFFSRGRGNYHRKILLVQFYC